MGDLHLWCLVIFCFQFHNGKNDTFPLLGALPQYTRGGWTRPVIATLGNHVYVKFLPGPTESYRYAGFKISYYAIVCKYHLYYYIVVLLIFYLNRDNQILYFSDSLIADFSEYVRLVFISYILNHLSWHFILYRKKSFDISYSIIIIWFMKLRLLNFKYICL